MKKILLLAATAVLFAACTSDEATVPEVAQEAPQAVAFDTYTPAATRAGEKGVMTTSTLMGTSANNYTDGTGFGVFAQYSDDGNYANTTSPSNFMWNQKVAYSASAWTYSPLKFWPNETESDSQTSDGAATSTATDKLSFFAYAPYVANLTSDYTGKLDGPTYSDAPEIGDSKITANGGGIEAIIANTATGNDPWVRYTIATKPSQSVDLLWGVAPAGGLSYETVNPNYGGTGVATLNVAEGMPLVNLIKPAKDQKIKFLFQHALARLGLTVVAAYDQIAPGGSPSATTKIAVKSVVITETTATKQLATTASLNLKNTTAFKSLWISRKNVGNWTFTIDNGTGGELNPNIAYNTTASDTYSQSGSWTGVTTSETPVIADNKYFMLIPNHADTQLQVVITYDVITKDDAVSGGYSEVENVITKKVTIPNLTNNKAYNLKLILGLTSVKLDAEVADWEVEGSTEVNLPRNNE